MNDNTARLRKVTVPLSTKAREQLILGHVQVDLNPGSSLEYVMGNMWEVLAEIDRVARQTTELPGITRHQLREPEDVLRYLAYAQAAEGNSGHSSQSHFQALLTECEIPLQFSQEPTLGYCLSYLETFKVRLSYGMLLLGLLVGDAPENLFGEIHELQKQASVTLLY
jgi:hypothetical protein